MKNKLLTICDELVGLELCESEQNGKRVLLHLGADRLAIWNKALPFLRSPKLRVAHVQAARPDTVLWFNAGLSALSRYERLEKSEQRPEFYRYSNWMLKVLSKPDNKRTGIKATRTAYPNRTCYKHRYKTLKM